jgi:hypothetical protein
MSRTEIFSAATNRPLRWFASTTDPAPLLHYYQCGSPPSVIGVNGVCVVCVLNFQATTAGETRLSLTRAVAFNSTQWQLLSSGSQATISVY